MMLDELHHRLARHGDNIARLGMPMEGDKPVYAPESLFEDYLADYINRCVSEQHAPVMAQLRVLDAAIAQLWTPHDDR